jgi:hypothetical protein
VVHEMQDVEENDHSKQLDAATIGHRKTFVVGNRHDFWR